MKSLVILLGLAFLGAGCCSMKCPYSKDASVPTDAADVKPLLVSQNVPEVSVKKPTGQLVSLKEIVTQKPSVVVFYRGGWCPFCNRHLSGLNTIYPELKKLGYQLIAISSDRPEKLAESTKKLTLDYELLSDNDMDAAKAFGIAFKLPDDLVAMYKAKYKIDVEADSGRDHHMLPVPSVFLVSKTGKIDFAYVNPDYRTRLSSQVLLAAAKAALTVEK
jgi:peroxiredoxin